MTQAEVISIVALMVSVGSLLFTIYFNFRDQARIVTKSTFVSNLEPGTDHVTATIVNAGRRPVILRMWAGVDERGKWAGTFFDPDKGGLRLGESEVKEIRIGQEDLRASTREDEDVWIKDIWVEDSLGRRHYVRNARENIAKLWQSLGEDEANRRRMLLLLSNRK